MGLGDNRMGEEVMPATQLRVSLLSVTPNAEALVYANAKQCTSADDAISLYEKAVVMPSLSRDNLIRRVMASGHLGIVEPVMFSFGVAGVSRALSHQLVRQRIASFCQQSQRYVKADDFDYVVPPSINTYHEDVNIETRSIDVWPSDALQAFNDAMNLARETYRNLIRLGIPAEDARFVLPNACETKICVTMNTHSLINFFERRCCARAQWEIRALANEMLRLGKEAVPVLFEKAGAACVRKGFCEEEKGCGRAPRLKDVMEKYKEDAPCAS